MKKIIQRWFLAISAVIVTVGVMLGLTLSYIFKGEFNFSVLSGTLTGDLILIVINLGIILIKKVKRPKTSV